MSHNKASHHTTLDHMLCTVGYMAQTAGVYEWISGRVDTSEEVGWMMYGHVWV